jgi:hypothetical protein
MEDSDSNSNSGFDFSSDGGFFFEWGIWIQIQTITMIATVVVIDRERYILQIEM